MISRAVLLGGVQLQNKGVGAPRNMVLAVCSFLHWRRVAGTVALQRVVQKVWIHRARKEQIHKTAAGAPGRVSGLWRIRPGSATEIIRP